VTATQAVSLALLALGTLVLVLAAVGATAPPSPLVRLHYVGLATMLGAPLVIAGSLVRDPQDWFKLVLISALLMVSSPVATAATARALFGGDRERDGPGNDA